MKNINGLMFAVMFLSSAAFAQVQVEVSLPPPPEIRFEVAPQLVEVSPGIQVVPDREGEEIFFHSGFYWLRRDGRWWRSRDGRGGWAFMDRRHVPGGLYGIPDGRYRRWRAERRNEDHAIRKEERREERHEVKAERREQRHEEHAGDTRDHHEAHERERENR